MQATTPVDPEDIMLSETSQSEDKYHQPTYRRNLKWSYSQKQRMVVTEMRGNEG